MWMTTLSDAELLERMREALDYDATLGRFYQKGRKGIPRGQLLGCPATDGKLQATLFGRRYYVSYLVWLWETGALPDGPLTHVNKDGTDDRFSNLARSAISRDTSSFITKAKAKFGDAHDYRAVDYINSNTKVRIACSAHGPFARKPGEYLASESGCPRCCEEAARVAQSKPPNAVCQQCKESFRKKSSGDARCKTCRLVGDRPDAVFIIIHGERFTPQEIADIIGVDRQVVYARLRNGWSAERVLTTPMQPTGLHGGVIIAGEVFKLSDLAEASGVTRRMMQRRGVRAKGGPRKILEALARATVKTRS
jgi:hypothetical protein